VALPRGYCQALRADGSGAGFGSGEDSARWPLISFTRRGGTLSFPRSGAPFTMRLTFPQEFGWGIPFACRVTLVRMPMACLLSTSRSRSEVRSATPHRLWLRREFGGRTSLRSIRTMWGSAVRVQHFFGSRPSSCRLHTPRGRRSVLWNCFHRGLWSRSAVSPSLKIGITSRSDCAGIGRSAAGHGHQYSRAMLWHRGFGGLARCWLISMYCWPAYSRHRWAEASATRALLPAGTRGDLVPAGERQPGTGFQPSRYRTPAPVRRTSSCSVPGTGSTSRYSGRSTTTTTSSPGHHQPHARVRAAHSPR
jgi:hypothetical protein